MHASEALRISKVNASAEEIAIEQFIENNRKPKLDNIIEKITSAAKVGLMSVSYKISAIGFSHKYKSSLATVLASELSTLGYWVRIEASELYSPEVYLTISWADLPAGQIPEQPAPAQMAEAPPE